MDIHQGQLKWQFQRLVDHSLLLFLTLYEKHAIHVERVGILQVTILAEANSKLVASSKA